LDAEGELKPRLITAALGELKCRLFKTEFGSFLVRQAPVVALVVK
jgi:hypothetical protein